MLTMNLTTEYNSDYDKNFGDVRKRLMKTMFQFRDGEISGEELMARVAKANAVTDKIMREIKAQKRLLLAGKNS
jgi:virulence-associated protein VapD